MQQSNSLTVFNSILGIFWPVKAFDQWLLTISHALPLTYSAQGIRSILVKGECV